jgi:hypothetical protein
MKVQVEKTDQITRDAMFPQRKRDEEGRGGRWEKKEDASNLLQKKKPNVDHLVSSFFHGLMNAKCWIFERWKKAASACKGRPEVERQRRLIG